MGLLLAIAGVVGDEALIGGELGTQLLPLSFSSRGMVQNSTRRFFAMSFGLFGSMGCFSA
ncbi:hypothetical protein ACN28S_57075 [Cystobacter fuscus]